MTTDEWIGAAGVFLLLSAFALNAFGRLPVTHRAYPLLNAGGAGLACYASWRIDFMPFVVLEGTWCLVALTALITAARGSTRRATTPTGEKP